MRPWWMEWVMLVALLLAAGPAALAQQSIPPGKVTEGLLSFDARATAGDFTGSTTAVSGEMSGGANLGAVHGFVEAPAASLKSGNDRRDRDLNKSLESGKFPTLRFDLERLEPAHGDSVPAPSDSIPVTLHGRLTIHGVTRPVDMPGFVMLAPDHAQLRTTFPLNLKDYKIGGLSKMLGMLRMHEDIVVHTDISFGYGK